MLFSAGEGVYVDLNIGFGHGADATDDLYISIEGVWGSPFNDVIIGHDGENDLRGYEGNDTLMPLAGFDFLSGGQGSDIYWMEKSYGRKLIDNFDSNSTLDFIKLDDAMANNTYVFKMFHDLYIAVNNLNRSMIIQSEDNPNNTEEIWFNASMDIIVSDWFNGSEFQHIELILADTTKSESDLSGATDITECVQYMVNYTDFMVTVIDDTRLNISWPTDLVNITRFCNIDISISINEFRRGKQVGTSQSSAKLVTVNGTSLTRIVNHLKSDTKYSVKIALTKASRILAQSNDVTIATDKTPLTPVWVALGVFMGMLLFVLVFIVIWASRGEKLYRKRKQPEEQSALVSTHAEQYGTSDVEEQSALVSTRAEEYGTSDVITEDNPAA